MGAGSLRRPENIIPCQCEVAAGSPFKSCLCMIARKDLQRNMRCLCDGARGKRPERTCAQKAQGLSHKLIQIGDFRDIPK